MFGRIGGMELLLLLVLVLVFFGTGRLSQVMGDMGRGIRNFKNGLQGAEETSPSAQEQEKGD